MATTRRAASKRRGCTSRLDPQFCYREAGVKLDPRYVYQAHSRHARPNPEMAIVPPPIAHSYITVV
jgi:hypothetical protein